MADNESSRLAQLALAAQTDEYKEVWEQWKTIDTKAQGAAIVSGVILTGLFTVLRDSPPDTDLKRWLVSLSVVGAVAASIFSLCALRVRSLKSAPFGEEIGKLVGDVEARAPKTDEWPVLYENLIRDATTLWKAPLKENSDALSDKADYLWYAQICVISSIVLLAAVTLIRVFSSGASGA